MSKKILVIVICLVVLSIGGFFVLQHSKVFKKTGGLDIAARKPSTENMECCRNTRDHDDATGFRTALDVK